MRIHHLNCGTLRPLGGRTVNGNRLPFLSARMVTHCLLVEADGRLVLVDTGFGLTDIARMRRLRSALRPRPGHHPSDSAAHRLTRYAYTKLGTRARLDPDETAVRQVARLGYSAADVTDVVLTHMDLDHAGGLPDFPTARVHVDQAERDFATSAASSAAGAVQRFRYWPYQWAHGPRWVTYPPGAGEGWFGFDGVRPLDGLPDMALVPLPGHSPGHSGVALRLGRSGAGERWLLHVADAYFDHREVDRAAPRSTPGLAAFQKRFEFDAPDRRDNRARLRELAAAHAGQVEMFCSHDPVEFDRYGGCDARQAP
jgi:glyoxylase-like metal-dependent hydrolase (beta-lactamase superfamily II)